MSNIWFVADTHFHHSNLVRGTSLWEDKSSCRNFDTLEEHDDLLVQNINKYVKEGDILYHIGDWSFGGREEVYNFRSRVNCKTIHLITGNHDVLITRNTTIVQNEETIHLQSLFTSVNQYLYKKIGGEKFVLGHYAFRTWEGAHHGSINVHGHSHGSLLPYTMSLPTDIYSSGNFVKNIPVHVNFKQKDVGIDCHPEFRPFHIDEIKSYIATCIPLRVDHHINRIENE